MQPTHDDSRAALNLVRHGTALGEAFVVPSHRRAGRLALVLFFVLLALSVYLFMHTHRIFNQADNGLRSDSDNMRINQYSRQIAVLEEKMSVFIADSVEDRLHTLEKNVADGKVGEQEIRGIEALKNEVKMLADYSAGKGGHVIDTMRLDHPRLQLAPWSPQQGRHDQMLDELMRLKQLLYLSIASSGTVGLLLGGYWWRNSLRVRRLQTGPTPKLLRGPDSDS